MARQGFSGNNPFTVNKDLPGYGTPAVQAQLDVTLQGGWTGQAGVCFQIVDLKTRPLVYDPDLVDDTLDGILPARAAGQKTSDR